MNSWQLYNSNCYVKIAFVPNIRTAKTAFECERSCFPDLVDVICHD